MVCGWGETVAKTLSINFDFSIYNKRVEKALKFSSYSQSLKAINNGVAVANTSAHTHIHLPEERLPEEKRSNVCYFVNTYYEIAFRRAKMCVCVGGKVISTAGRNSYIIIIHYDILCTQWLLARGC